MKKILSIICCCLLLSVFAVPAFAEADGINVTVTIAEKGELRVAAEKISVTDIDGDGALTVNDALFCAHEKCYDGGAAAGYASANSDWGLSITKLWGDESGNFGYYVNNASASGLTDPVKDGDTVCAFVYSDGTGFSDKYCWFDAEANDDGSTGLTLTAASFDSNWQPVTLPVSGAVITIDGVRTEAVTDEAGKASITVEKPGDHIISAVSDTMILVPPVLKMSVKGADFPYVIVIAAAAVVIITKQKANEK